MNQHLVSIKRSGIDSNKIQGFVLDESDELLLLLYVYDFNLDGYMVLSKEDITYIETTDTDKFQTRLLEKSGALKNVNFNVCFNLSSWKEFINSARKEYTYFIFEEEKLEKSELTIGLIVGTAEESFQMKYFTGIGSWLEEIECLNYSDITSCQIRSKYLNMYENYFQKNEDA